MAIQIRTLRQLQDSEFVRQNDMALLQPQPLGTPAPTPAASQLALTVRAPSMSTSSTNTSINDIMLVTQKIQERQFSIDEHLDKENLHAIPRTALHEPDYANLIRLLEVGEPKMPEVIKTLQRLEEISSEKDLREEETIHKEFIESGIDALRRVSGEITAVPSWTITEYDEVRPSHTFRVPPFSLKYLLIREVHRLPSTLTSPTPHPPSFTHSPTAVTWAQIVDAR
jgi:hypothetical protein